VCRRRLNVHLPEQQPEGRPRRSHVLSADGGLPAAPQPRADAGAPRGFGHLDASARTPALGRGPRCGIGTHACWPSTGRAGGAERARTASPG
jgi:hypothetical protein